MVVVHCNCNVDLTANITICEFPLDFYLTIIEFFSFLFFRWNLAFFLVTAPFSIWRKYVHWNCFHAFKNIYIIIFLFLFCFVFQSRLKPGRMLLVDTEERSIIQDVELKLRIAQSRPHAQWLQEQVVTRSIYLLIYYLILWTLVYCGPYCLWTYCKI